MLIATWWGVGIAALFGLGGLIVGIAGLVQSHRARESAASANLIAKDANSVARQANTFAVEANTIAGGANQLAAESNNIARRANDLAGETNIIAKGEAARAAELHRIDWQLDWDTPGRYRVQNLGPDAAIDVRAQITVDDETVEGTTERLEKDQAIILEFPGALATYRRECDERVEDGRWRSAQRETGLFGGVLTPFPLMSNLGPLHGADHFIRDLVTWRSPSGNPQKHDEQHRMCGLG